MRPSSLVFLVAGAAACTSAGAANLTTPSTPTLEVHNPIGAGPDLKFSPENLTIVVGDSVTFVVGSVEHIIEFQKGEELKTYYGGSSSSGAPANVGKASNTQAVRVFATKGSFRFRCSIHSGMHGEIIVQ
jgi:plastocyanin